MKVRGRNRKWFRTGNGGTIGKVGFVVVFELHTRIGECCRDRNALVIIDVIEHCTYVSQHKCIGSENRSRNGRGSVNRKEGTDSGELVADFFLFNIEEVGNMFDHLLMSHGHFVTGGTVRRRGGDDVGGVASATSGR